MVTVPRGTNGDTMAREPRLRAMVFGFSREKAGGPCTLIIRG
jgi:hypothetical protein